MGDDLKKLTEDLEDFSVETDYKLGDLASGPVPDPDSARQAAEDEAAEKPAPSDDEAESAPKAEPAEPAAPEAQQPQAPQPAAPAQAAPPVPVAPAPPAKPVQLPDKLEIPRRSMADLDEDGNPIDPKKALEEFKRQQGMGSARSGFESSAAGPGAAAAVAVAAPPQSRPLAAESAAGAQAARGEMLKLHRPDFGPDEEAAVLSVLRSGWLTKGPCVVDFERAFAQRVGAPAALGLNSCTAALHTALMAAGVRPGDEVIVPAMTFAASANVVVHCGATPVFCDVHADTHCFDAAHAASLVNARTRALIPVHFAGIPCDMQPIWELAHKNNLFVLEDCAHAVETEYLGKPVGAMRRDDAPGGGSRFGAYSFYATKNLITGEGGMLTCADPADMERARVVSLHGMSVDAWKRYAGADGSSGDFKLYDIVAAGYKYNMFELQAALGLVQLAKLDANWQRRRALVARYDKLLAEAFPGGEFSGLSYPEYGRSAHHLYIARLSEELAGRRDNVIRGLRARNVEAYVHYICLTGTQFYRENFSTSPKQTPVAASLGQRSITLPLYPTMRPEDVDFVVEMLKQALGTN
ncbi:DegT/DnrJ/EryC1/StrS family aminotransferase [bacterium]|nr:DegT/DnrJ/EryC1/StrS family aminotransferase [bacterium]